MALSILGIAGTVENINNPQKSNETVFALWYETTRRELIRLVKPNFAKKRALLPLVEKVQEFGYSYAYQYPADCLFLLGVGNMNEKRNNYVVEGKFIYTDFYSSEKGLPARYIEDVEEVSRFTPDFSDLFAYQLAQKVCMEIKGDKQLLQLLEQNVISKRVCLCAQESQENIPIRLSRSKLINGRAGYGYYEGKK